MATTEELSEARSVYYTWNDYNAALLERLFTDERAKGEYVGYGMIAMGDQALSVEIQDFRSDVASKLRKLGSVIERLELFEEPAHAAVATARPAATASGSKVFVVHGHDTAPKEAVARFIAQLGLEAVILHEQPNRGKTILEKFETHGNDVAFAVVLLSPDDIGGAESGEQHPRPRQNVVFELGYFFGKLGRDRVAALVPAAVERPTDIDGLVYIDGSGDAWKWELAREFKAAGLPVDVNKAL
jgi:predicted nucleotide-binding protein